jgi:hypothetical protein
MREIIIVLFCISFYHGHSEELSIDFYGTNIPIEFDVSSLKFCYKLRPNSFSLNQFYDKYRQNNYHVLLQSFQKQKDSLELNDWMYYKLIKKTVEQFYSKEKLMFKDAVVWFYLFETGYDVRVLFDENDLFLYAAIDSTDKENFDICAEIMVNGKRKYSLLNKISTPTQYDNIASKINRQGNFFNIYTKKLPLLTPQPIIKKVDFYIEAEYYELDFYIDKTLIDIWADAPSGCLGISFDVPLSTLTYSSLIPQIIEITKDKNILVKVDIILNFVTNTSIHRDDRVIYFREKYMTPEEALYYEYSDCDDRSSIFYFLIREILDIPLIVVNYQNREHVNVGVALNENIEFKSPYEYKGVDFFICEPSSIGTTKVGEFQDDLKPPFYIFKEYLPLQGNGANGTFEEK